MDVTPGYKKTEVGVIPADWGVSPLETFTKVVASGKSKHSKALGTYPVHGSTGIIGFTEFPEYEGEAILVARVGANAGRINIVSGRYGVTDNTIMLRLDEAASLAFIWRSLEAKRLNSLVFGSGQPLITGTQLKSIQLATPPLLEQHAIATALSDADVLLSELDQLIAKKRDLKQAAIQQLLTGQTRLPGFRGEREVKRLGDVAEIRKGSGLSKSLARGSGSRPCILYGELFTTYGRVISEVVGRTDSSDGLPSIFGDVLMPGSTTTTGIDLAAASALLRDNVSLGGDILVIRQSSAAYDPIFLASYLTHSRRHAIAELTQGITIHHLYGKDLKGLSLELPSLPEQTAIAAVLSDMDAELSALEARRDKTRNLKQAMMQELLTGKTRLVPAGDAHA